MSAGTETFQQHLPILLKNGRTLEIPFLIILMIIIVEILIIMMLSVQGYILVKIYRMQWKTEFLNRSHQAVLTLEIATFSACGK